MSIDELRQLVEKQDIPELRQAYQEMLDGCLRHPEQCIWYAPWNISLTGNPTESIGELGFKDPAVDGAVEIGYGLHPGYEGHGYMTEAVCAVIKWAFSLPEITTIFAETASENAASQGVLAQSDAWQRRCLEVCFPEEYAMLERAFFHKAENLDLPRAER